MTPIETAKKLIAADLWSEAATLLDPLTNTGDREADYLYGSLLYCGTDCVSPEAALEALRRASALNHPAACYRVATTTLEADGGIVTGPVVNRELLVHAAQLGDVDAQRDVGALHAREEEGLPKDLDVARYWYERAARQGHALSQYDLGFMMLQGEGGPVDLTAGLSWLETCAMQNELVSEEAAEFLAEIFESEYYGVSPDAEAVKRWRRRQSELLEAAGEETHG
jgi:TPR repeat protein